MIAPGARVRLLAAALAGAAALATADAAAPVFWRVSTQAEFLQGEVENLSVDPSGRLVLEPRAVRVVPWTDQGRPSVAATGGSSRVAGKRCSAQGLRNHRIEGAA